MAELNVTLQELRGTYKEFTAKNPILMDGQLAVVTIETGDSVGGFIAPSTGLKCGDGKTAFNNLTWLAGREQLINTGSTAYNAILHKQNQELYMTRSEFDKLDKTTLPVGTEINIVDQIQKQDLATDIQKSLANANTALTNANTALSTANNALPKSGGTITGDLVVSGNETLNGALTVSGTTTLSNTNFTAGSIVKRVDADGDEIGVVQFRHIDESAVPFGTFETGYDYRIGDADAVEWYFPETDIPSDLYAIMHFNSGATATTIMIDEDCVLTGDDCKGGVFTPVANKKYSVFVWYDGTKQGVVRGVPTDGKWEDGTITIGSSTETSPAELKKVVYCPSASVPTTPEAGVEYALTDLIGEEDLNSALQTKINSFATKTEVNAVSTVANNALPKSGGSVTGNLSVSGTLTSGGKTVATISDVDKAKQKYDYTFTDYDSLKNFLNTYSSTDTVALKGKHILMTGALHDFESNAGLAEYQGILNFHGADFTHEYRYNITSGTDHEFGTMKNIGTFYGEKCSSDHGASVEHMISIEADRVIGVGHGIKAYITADFVYDACVRMCTSKTGTTSSPYGTVTNCLFMGNSRVENYASVMNCSTTASDGAVTLTNCSQIGKQLKASQLPSTDSGSGSTAKWRYDATDASNTNPVKFIKFNSTFFDTSYCYNTVLSEILVGVRPSYLSGVASQMVRHQSNGNLIFVSVEYSTETDGSLSSCTVSCFDTNQNTDMGSATYTKGRGWSGDGYLTVSLQYYY